jgi:hypothetical protein
MPNRRDRGGELAVNLINYIYLSILFTIGAATVLVRRNAIIVFMGIELMLNAANLAFVDLRAHPRQPRRPGHRAVRHGRGRRRGRRRSGDHHGDLPCPPIGLGRRRQPAEAVREKRVSVSLTTMAACPQVCRSRAKPTVHAATGFASAAWLLVALPLLGAAILLLGGHRTDKWGPLFATGMSWAAFVVGARRVYHVARA